MADVETVVVTAIIVDSAIITVIITLNLLLQNYALLVTASSALIYIVTANIRQNYNKDLQTAPNVLCIAWIDVRKA